jgi:hypothetical protein
MFFAQALFQECARIDAGCGMALKEDAIAGLISVARVQEVIERNFKQCREGSVGCNVSADAMIKLVLAMNHDHRIPPSQALDVPLHRPVARIRLVFGTRNRVDVRRIVTHGQHNAGQSGSLCQPREQVRRSSPTLISHYLFQCFQPLGRLLRIQVRTLVQSLLHEHLSDKRKTIAESICT